MLTLWGAIAAFTVFGGLPTVGGLWVFERTRARRRNQQGRCAVCGESWQTRPSRERYLIHGRLVCEGCAQRARGRVLWQLGAVGVAAIAAGIGSALAGGNPAMIVIVPIGLPVVMTVGVIQWMKRANRVAQRRIATGEYPDFEALSGEPTPGEVQRLPG